MKKEIVFDIKIWLVVGLLLPFTIRGAQSYPQLLLLTGSMWVSLICLFYPHEWLIRHFLKQKKWLSYTAGLLGLIFLASSFMVLAIVSTSPLTPTLIVSSVSSVVLMIIVMTGISYGYKGILLSIQFEKIKSQQIEAELKLLQSQVNPHFLFNTLNNIYAQNLINQEEANDMILQLADLMRYQIESAKKNTVPIQDEIEFINNYLALEKKRLTNRIKTSFTIDIADDLMLQIPPMLFIPFIENAYKHGISSEDGCFIHINLSIKSHLISFTIDNAISLKKQAIKSTKTGLDNIKKRLNLLFPDKYQLIIRTDNNMYHVQLEIKL
jgi:sensor histidine kinase YesM